MIASLLAALALSGCGEASSDEGSAGSDDDLWECTSGRDGWEQCDGKSVIWCHSASHGEFEGGHFHESENCSEDGFSCVELDERTAACANPDTTCSEGFSECDGREARNCVDGTVAAMRCSLAEECRVTDVGARCVSTAGEE
jgi:hypothetical protein